MLGHRFPGQSTEASFDGARSRSHAWERFGPDAFLEAITCRVRRSNAATSQWRALRVMADITVVIPTFNRGPLLAQTVEPSASEPTRRHSRSRDHRRRRRVHASRSGASGCHICLATVHASEWFARRTPGPGAARNTGFRQSRGVLVVFMDDDILARPRPPLKASRGPPSLSTAPSCSAPAPLPMSRIRLSGASSTRLHTNPPPSLSPGLESSRAANSR